MDAAKEAKAEKAEKKSAARVIAVVRENVVGVHVQMIALI